MRYWSIFLIACTVSTFCKIEHLPEHIKTLMIDCSWKPECPVPLENLRYVTVHHWGYDGEIHTGHMVVHGDIAHEIEDIFQELFQARFPIEHIELIDYYNADDERSMEANNTSAFCCRAITNKPGTFSHHSYGVAIDINPRTNPYIKGDLVLPKNAHEFVDRTKSYVGMIIASPDNACYQAFISRGYEWGGSWTSRQDYQHFSKYSAQATS